jgi:3-oxoacyl-(acyl-carrier-protein) synthase
MKRRRVKITGIGFVTPAGIGKQSFEQGILETRSYVSVIKRFPEEAGPFVASEVKRFNVDDHGGENGAKRLPRHTQFALAAAKLAVADAGLTPEMVQKLDPVVVTGTSLMDSDVVNKTIENVAKKGPRFGLARVVFHGPVASIGAAVAEAVGGGRTLSLQSACCSGTDAIGQAANLVANGEADIAICGGTEAPIYYHPMLELKMAELSPATAERPEQLSRPFDMWRTTGVIGEGACILVLEPESSPRPGYSFLIGYSFSTDPINSVGEGMAEAVQLCLANAKIRPQEIDLINAWGPGHREIDVMETIALHKTMGAEINRIPVVSIKGAIGNPFGAAGAIQAGCAALGQQRSFVPPTVNYRHPDPACRLNLSAKPRFMDHHITLVNSHGLSGTNASLLLQRCD